MTVPVAIDPADSLQVGIYELLTNDATLMALVTGVYDQVPEEATPPYVVIGEMLSTEDSVHNGHGRQTAVMLHTWTRERSFRPGNQAAAQLVALLTRRQDTLDTLVDDHTVYMAAHEFSQTLRDPDPEIRHRVDRFRIWTRQEDA